MNEKPFLNVARKKSFKKFNKKSFVIHCFLEKHRKIFKGYLKETQSHSLFYKVNAINIIMN